MIGGLTPDCSRCFGLCCTALPFTVSADFAQAKPAGQPCRHLGPDYRCGIHRELRTAGFAGCASFDCFGAGQQVSQHTFAGISWRDEPALAGEMFAAFEVMRQLHEMLWHLTGMGTERGQQLQRAIERLAGLPAPELMDIDLAGLRGDVASVLAELSARIRSRQPGAARREWARRDLAGARLAGRNLRGADLRGALLLAADLSGTDLTDADLLGADLRDARLAGARLAGSLFLTQPQLNAAVGDRHTTLPPRLSRPGHWA